MNTMIRRVARGMCVTLLVGWLAANPVTGQATYAEGELVDLALEAVLESLSLTVESDQTIQVDLSELPEVNRPQIANHLSMDQALQSDVVQCPARTGRLPHENCYLDGSDYLVKVYDIALGQQRAVVKIGVQGEDRGSHYQAIWSAGWRVHLSHNGAGWSVAEIELLWEA